MEFKTAGCSHLVFFYLNADTLRTCLTSSHKRYAYDLGKTILPDFLKSAQKADFLCYE